MAILDPATVLALAIQCSPVRIDPRLVLAIARTESGLDTSARHVNANGSLDVGLMQVNSSNFSWLGLTTESALDPCQSIRAGVRVLTSLSAYNTGNQIAGFGNGYVQKVVASYREPTPLAVHVTQPSSSIEDVPIPDEVHLQQGD